MNPFHVFTENLAIHKPAWQSSNLLPYTGADRAVDGQYVNLKWDGGQCSSSSNIKTVEWRVDLGIVWNIYRIFIQYVTGNNVWGTVCF